LIRFIFLNLPNLTHQQFTNLLLTLLALIPDSNKQQHHHLLLGLMVQLIPLLFEMVIAAQLQLKRLHQPLPQLLHLAIITNLPQY